jgi:glycosyltransferase involved in cell wall biosynthesis
MIPQSGDRPLSEIMRQHPALAPRLDIIIPVYNEGRNILATLAELREHVRAPSRILICYDHPDDDTLSTINAHPECT